ncbi:MAG: hypothetical protein ACTS2F_14405 [Thainema sp.]
MLSVNSRAASHLFPESQDSYASLTAAKVARFLCVVVTILVICSIVTTLMMYLLPDFFLKGFLFYKFSVNQEQNFPTLYSSLSLAACAVLLFAIAQFKRQTRGRYINHWRFLSLTFLYLSIDELTEIHEAASKPMHNLGVNGFFHNAWLIPAGLVLLIFGLSFLGFLFHLPKPIRRLFIFAFCLYLSGAALVELFSGYYAFVNGRENLGYVLFTTVEETLEMLGIVAFIYALLTYMQKVGIRWLDLRVKIGNAQE